MLLLNLLLALAWMALTGEFDPINFAASFIMGFLILRLLQRPDESLPYFGRVLKVIQFILFYLWELLKANLRVAAAVLSPRLRLIPAVVAVPLEVHSDLAITLLSNLITLTPGSLTVDVSTDCRFMYVHTMHAEDIDRFRRDIKILESRVMEVTQ
jgi:multicomponent Na+:H+ antiporter subunit E